MIAAVRTILGPQPYATTSISAHFCMPAAVEERMGEGKLERAFRYFFHSGNSAFNAKLQTLHACLLTGAYIYR
jgi:hypothetical protein